MFTTNPETSTKQRLKVGGPLRVLLVVENAPLRMRMAEIVRSVEGLTLVGSYATTADAIDWMVWDRQGCHLAFVDLGLQGDGARAVVERVMTEARVGTVVAIGDHLWREVRSQCAEMGVFHLLEKGDIVAFRSFLEDQVR
jgi:DNA-binding NarL/FixJ family response regulator